MILSINSSLVQDNLFAYCNLLPFRQAALSFDNHQIGRSQPFDDSHPTVLERSVFGYFPQERFSVLNDPNEWLTLIAYYRFQMRSDSVARHR